MKMAGWFSILNSQFPVRIRSLATTALALLLLLAGLVAAGFAPLRINLDLGQDQGPSRPDAFAFDFHPPERREHAAFRWSRESGRLVLPGLGQQPLGVSLEILAHRAQFVQPDRPTPLELSVNGRHLDITLRQPAAHYTLFVPASWMAGGNMDLILSTPP